MTMPDDGRLPSIPVADRSLGDLGGSGLPPSLQILLDEGLYNRMKQLATLMSRAEGFTPRHLIGKGEACFAIINTALDWKLNPHFVARHTYQTPGGSIGFDGALVQGVLESSNKFIGSPKFEYRGDWEKLTGKFEKKTSGKGNEYVVGTWTDEDALGLGIIVRWQVRGEAEQRCWPGETTPFWLTQCYPRNSPLWATDPKTQIAYLAIRRFANLAAPGILGAASFDYDDMIEASDLARDVTPPRPRPEDFVERETPTETKSFEVIDFIGEAHEYQTEIDAIEALVELIGTAKSQQALDGLIESQTLASYPSIIEAYKDKKEALSNPGDSQDRPAAGAPSPAPARGATASAEAGHTEHPGGGSQSTPDERRAGAGSKDDRPRDADSLVVNMVKPPGKPIDYVATKDAMVAVIATKIKTVADVERFRIENHATINNWVQVGKNNEQIGNLWRDVQYYLVQRHDQLMSGEA
jgi:hypothetical protein